MKLLPMLVLGMIAAPAIAQIQFINPFGGSIRVIHPFAAPQGSLSPLTTTSSTGYSLTPTDPLTSSGLATKFFSWCGNKWSNDSGQTWNTQVPYALGFNTTCGFRAELHDTTNDRGQSDPSSKRRAEIHEKLYMNNGVKYCYAFTYMDQPWQRPMLQGGAISQDHMPNGGSPAFALRRFPNGSFGGTINPGGNKKIFSVAMSFGAPHDIITCVVMQPSGNSSGLVDVWMDGIQRVHYVGPLGATGNGYYLTLGNYYAGGTNGNDVVAEYHNIVSPTTNDLSSRILSPPAW